MLLLCLLVLLAACGPALGTWNTCGGTCGVRPTTSDEDQGKTRVVGGTSAQEGAWPWLVSIQYPEIAGTGHLCGGSLISTQWVLTAAHCFVDARNISTFRVVIGTTQLTELGPGAEVRQVERLLVHEDYNAADQSNDIALLELDRPVECNLYVQLGCVPNDTVDVSELDTCYVAGWGATTARAQKSSDVLQEAQVHLIDVQLCNSSDWYAGDVHTHNLCAGHPEGGIDTCQGDSGGPLMCKDDDADYFWVVGVTSWGKGCARAKRPGIYTSTQHFYNWILRQMGLLPDVGAPTTPRTWGYYPTTAQPWGQFPTAARPTQNPWPRPPATQNPWPRPPATQPLWTRPPATQPPWTRPPATQPPWTRPPATQPPWTRPPATQPPWTRPPATQPPWTRPPATQPLWTRPPATQPPWTKPPATQPLWTKPPATQPLWTRPPATQPLWTKPPATQPLWTKPPATQPLWTKPPATQPLWTRPPATQPPWTSPTATQMPKPPPTPAPKPKPPPTPADKSCPFPAKKLVEFFTQMEKLLQALQGKTT